MWHIRLILEAAGTFTLTSSTLSLPFFWDHSISLPSSIRDFDHPCHVARQCQCHTPRHTIAFHPFPSCAPWHSELFTCTGCEGGGRTARGSERCPMLSMACATHCKSSHYTTQTMRSSELAASPFPPPALSLARSPFSFFLSFFFFSFFSF